MKLSNENLTIKHYKEPLLPIPEGKGFGYYGALIVTTNGENVQCHICGKLFGALSTHIHQVHNIQAREYRKRFKLSPTTALLSEVVRENRSRIGLEVIAKIKERYGKNWREHFVKQGKKGTAKRGKHQPKEALEAKNKKGTCPDQLIQKIKDVKDQLGHTPSLAEFMEETGGQRYKHLIIATFGSWLNALHMANLAPKIRDKGIYRRHTTEELLEYLAIFAREHNKLPTASDCRRGLLPTYDVFLRRFGSMDKARKLAGVYDIVN